MTVRRGCAEADRLLGAASPSEIGELPDGEYSGADDLSRTTECRSEPFDVKVRVVIRGDEVIADFTGSSPQVRGPMNCTYVVAASALYNAVFCVTDPLDADPAQRRLLSPDADDRAGGERRQRQAPRPVGRRQHRPAAEADRPPAGGARSSRPRSRRGLDRRIKHRTSCSEVYTQRRANTSQTTTSTVWAPAGRQQKDGNDGEITRHSNCRNTPIEVFEHRYPLLTLEYRLVADTGGAGCHRGGLGTQAYDPRDRARDHLQCALRPLQDSPRGPQRRSTGRRIGAARPPRGRHGVPSVRRGVRRHVADEVHQHTPSLGRRVAIPRARRCGVRRSPTSRDPELVREDVLDGYVTAQACERDYGIAVEDERLAR